MDELQSEQPKRRIRKTSRFIAFDAWLDSALYELRFGFARFWERVCIASNALTVRGWRRSVFELAGEAASLGTLGAVLLFALAIPALKETDGDWLKQEQIAVTFLDRFGTEIGQRGLIQRQSVPVAEMPQHVIFAVLATEDRRFFDHFGLDFIGLVRAMTENARAGDVVQGGSTLTQQLAKNLFLTNERTLQRKINEAFLAVWLEANLTKQQILQLYLDRAYMGGGTFGITAAADFYFGKNLKDVSLAEAAMLAGLFKAPAKYAPHINLPAARARANEVLNNIVEAGFLTDGQVLAARREPADALDRERTSEAEYFLDWAYEQMLELANALPARVFTVKTTLDPVLQEAAEESVEFHLRQFGTTYDVDQAAVVLIDTNGAVRAMVGGRDYGRSQFNRATSGKRPTGSSFKPYIYATALEAGAKADDIAADTPFSWGDWSPKNYGGGHAGRMTLTQAMATSNNVIAARLGRQVGIKAITEMAHTLGVKSTLDTYAPMVLGTSGITVLEQAAAFNIFANGGFSGTLRGVEQVFGPDGTQLYEFERDANKPVRVLKETTVAGMNTMLAQVPISGTARRAALDGILSAGKTGTTQDYRDAWYVGYTGNFTAAVWAGKDDYTVTNRMTGGSLPAMVWKRMMTFAHRDLDLKTIPYLEEMVAPEVKVAAKTGETEDVGFVSTLKRNRPLPGALQQRLADMHKALMAAPALTAKDPESTASIRGDARSALP
jgi:penicillin-binding protein 1A